MSTPEEVVLRWKTVASSLGIRLTDEDIERIGVPSTVERIARLDDIVRATGARDVVPDYLADTRKTGGTDE